MEEQIIEILENIRPGVNYAAVTDLIDGKYLKSGHIIQLVGELNDEFDIEIGFVDLVAENFNSVAAMAALVERLQDE